MIITSSDNLFSAVYEVEERRKKILEGYKDAGEDEQEALRVELAEIEIWLDKQYSLMETVSTARRERKFGVQL